jgi:hypothetical protein
MSTLSNISAALPGWFLPLGWLLLLLGWALGRPKVQTVVGKIIVVGFDINITSTVHHVEAAKDPAGDSPLSKASSWATLVGLLLTLLPMIQAWLKPGA